MGNFHIQLDTKFNELFIKLKEKQITVEDLIELKSVVINAYYDDNNEDNEFIKSSLSMIDFRI